MLKVRGGRDLVRAGALAVTRRLAERLHFDLVHRDYYSPIPDLRAVPEAIWERRSHLHGIAWDERAQLRWLEQDLLDYVEEFERRYADGAIPAYTSDNVSYGPLDAHVLWAVIRRMRPTRVLELGSGFSTLVSAAACALNRADGHPVRFVAVDPFPGAVLTPVPPGLDELRAARVQDVPFDEFRALGDGDVLFVDTTHTVKLGSEVNWLLLEILPELAPGVLVHLHDVFLPWEYPREWAFERAYYWTEQYLLQALLCENPRWEVMLASHHLARTYRSRLLSLVPALRQDAPARPAAIWLRRA